MKAPIGKVLGAPQQNCVWVARGSFVALAAASALALAERPARACGGCFSPPTENTVVTDHRMAFSLSTQQTVLWDQIKYSGNPSDFSWVLPVRPGAVVQLSNDAWFGALDALTNPVITGPSPNCGGGGGLGSRVGASRTVPAASTGPATTVSTSSARASSVPTTP